MDLLVSFTIPTVSDVFPPLVVKSRSLNLEKSGFKVARDEAMRPRPISTVLHSARFVKLYR